MKRFYFKFRVLLLTLAFGLTSVPFFNGLYERWSRIPVNLPQTESESPLYVHPWQSHVEPKIEVKELIKEGRDLSLYDFGGDISNCGMILVTEAVKCEKEYAAARNFIWQHWQEKKLAYIVYNVSGTDAGVEFHIVIEPDENGEWHMIWFGERWGVDNEGTIIHDVKEVKRKRAENGSGKVFLGNLSFLDKNGQEVERW
jgi:hypothetical protein